MATTKPPKWITVCLTYSRAATEFCSGPFDQKLLQNNNSTKLCSTTKTHQWNYPLQLHRKVKIGFARFSSFSIFKFIKFLIFLVLTIKSGLFPIAKFNFGQKFVQRIKKRIRLTLFRPTFCRLRLKFMKRIFREWVNSNDTFTAGNSLKRLQCIV